MLASNGKTIALAEAGAQVLVHYGTSIDDARSVVERVRAKGGKAEAVGAALADSEGPANVMVHGRFSGTGRPSAWIAVDILRIENGQRAEHWDVLQDEATSANSVSGLPMFGTAFPG